MQPAPNNSGKQGRAPNCQQLHSHYCMHLQPKAYDLDVIHVFNWKKIWDSWTLKKYNPSHMIEKKKELNSKPRFVWLLKPGYSVYGRNNPKRKWLKSLHLQVSIVSLCFVSSAHTKGHQVLLSLKSSYPPTRRILPTKLKKVSKLE